ncbi:VacJ family lipoprotein [uncultured Erythrobacter sp.]|uniref:MlaA family lipoprotein n=1 Tax=uncultured Erythrobacter sp. TaxID=263913 RepID=UPI002627F831|nr:VacJ family lipoprotein [uncultured Erythrobacter sp.]
MPNSTLIVLTSPMLLGPAPAVDVAAAAAIVPPAIAAQEVSFKRPELLPISWSLVAGQEQGDPPVGSAPEAGDELEGQDETGNEIVVEGDYGPVEAGPVAAFNETSYRITQDLDSAITGPLAYGYRDGLPGPIRDGLGNVVRNLREPVNFLNFLLQFKIGDAFETLGRFAINSTIGLGGLIDVAATSNIDLPYRRNGFANTMGYYGVGSGTYLYLPITGATSLRDIIGDTLDQAVVPFAVGKPFNTPEYGVPYFIVSNLEARLEVDQELERIGETIDPYAARRDTYLYRREREIAELRGVEPPPPPAILREIEEGLDAIEYDDDFEAPAVPDDTPQAMIDHQRELPPIEVAVMITQPRRR